MWPYRGRNFWHRVMWDGDPTQPPPHTHRCPKCYEAKPCTMACSLEEDLELDDGTPAGAHVVCGTCRVETETTPPCAPASPDQLWLPGLT